MKQWRSWVRCMLILAASLSETLPRAICGRWQSNSLMMLRHGLNWHRYWNNLISREHLLLMLLPLGYCRTKFRLTFHRRSSTMLELSTTGVRDVVLPNVTVGCALLLEWYLLLPWASLILFLHYKYFLTFNLCGSGFWYFKINPQSIFLNVCLPAYFCTCI